MDSNTAQPSSRQGLLQSAIGVAENHGFGNDAWETENAQHFWGRDPASLESHSTVESFAVGAGEDIFRNTLLPGLESAHTDVILVTCFWARSTSLELLSQSLRRLSEKAVRRTDGSRIRVFIGFSSRSLLQKLFHTSDPDGYVYPPLTWASTLGLPPPAQLPGLEMTVKSLFFRPFSVMHSKFMIIDGQRLWMPSCNVSWESWYEGCVSFRGSVVQQAQRFCGEVWRVAPGPGKLAESDDLDGNSAPDARVIDLSRQAHVTLLPSQHHAAISGSLPFGKRRCPMTPLNVTLLHLIADAQTSIELVTPNLTSPPVVDALLAALARGVNVSLITDRTMMVVEQLVTSLSVTEFWVWRLIRRYRKLRSRARKTDPSLNADDPALLEDGRASIELGRLEVHYFCSAASGAGTTTDLVKSHVKCTIVDNATVVLGSGNMDRASWYTSQELGVAVRDSDTALQIRGLLKDGLREKIEQHFP